MRTIKEIIALLLLAGIFVGLSRFLPGLALLFENYLVGFVLAAFIIPIVRLLYKSHKKKISNLPLHIQKKKKQECQDWWEETSEATYSPSRVLDPRNIYNDD
jgi:hypothetical protein